MPARLTSRLYHGEPPARPTPTSGHQVPRRRFHRRRARGHLRVSLLARGFHSISFHDSIRSAMLAAPSGGCRRRLPVAWGASRKREVLAPLLAFLFARLVARRSRLLVALWCISADTRSATVGRKNVFVPFHGLVRPRTGAHG